jgi:hypothetical protein
MPHAFIIVDALSVTIDTIFSFIFHTLKMFKISFLLLLAEWLPFVTFVDTFSQRTLKFVSIK